MTDKELNRTFIINKCDENELIFTECNKYLSNYATQYILEYRKLIEDFAYKNIPTSILQAMKLKIENELTERKLKEKEKSDE